MTPEQTGQDRCEAPNCESQHEEKAHYYIITGGTRKCYCAPCFFKREHELIRERLADDEAKKGTP